MTSRLRQKRDARKQGQQPNEPQSHLSHPNPEQQQASTRLWTQKAQSLPQAQQQYLESPSMSAQASSQLIANYVGRVQDTQQIKSPLSFALGPNQIGSQTHSSTTTTTTTTGQMTSGLRQNQSSTYLSQGISPQPLPRYTEHTVQNLQYATQEAAAQTTPQSAQQSFDYTQLANTATTPISQPAFDYMQLANIPSPAARRSAQPQGSMNTTRMTVAQTNVATSQQEQREAQRESKRDHSNEQHNLGNVISTSNDFSGQARQAAAARGDAELQRFDTTVQQLLMGASSSACPRGYRYYRGKDGYLCGGGSHLVSHEDVDNLVMYGVPPYIEVVNICLDPNLRTIPPPADGWDQPMHWSPQQRLANDMPPMQMKHDGTMWDLRPFRVAIAEYFEQIALEEEAEAAMFGGYWG